jgi:Putative auto-transporter adhesin, head GIN domain
MRAMIVASGALAVLVFVSGCGGTSAIAPSPAPTIGSGMVRTESRPVQGFSSVIVSAGGRVVIERTGTESLQISAEDNILPLVDATVINGRLILGLKSNASVTTHSAIQFRLTVRDLATIDASGASRVEFGDIDLRQLTVHLSGASSFAASGSLDDLTMDLSGVSRCEAAALRVQRAHLDLSGASTAVVRVIATLTASASGVSTVEFFGDPLVQAQTSGGSVVRRAGS